MINRKDLIVRDPFIYRENGKTYLLGTTGPDPWDKGSDLSIYETDDLENFTLLGALVRKDLLKEYKNIWAPELHKYNGMYYLIVTVFNEEKGRGSIILYSNKIESGYEFLTGKYITPEGWGCLDATLFVTKNKPYLCFSNEWTTPITCDGDGSLFIAPLSSDLKNICGKPKKIISGKYCGFAKMISSKSCKGFVAEGPWLFEENGKIALLWSTITKTGYSVIKSVANDVMGDYVFDKFIFTENGGHCMKFTWKDGKNYISLHQPNETPNERLKTFIYE